RAGNADPHRASDSRAAQLPDPAQDGLRVEAELRGDLHRTALRLEEGNFPLQRFPERLAVDLRMAFGVAGDAHMADGMTPQDAALEQYERIREGSRRLRR